ncbi:MAG: alpha-N-acetylglucosaminidase [Puniceicoccales bacterium]|jgi:alpha-N-acetylglucosaminidase|nr:alpha-N-acetylglucosaminidase [Puniceicoccales bacterium]
MISNRFFSRICTAVTCLVTLVLVTPLLHAGEATTTAAYRLLERVLPEGRAAEFVVESIPAENGKDVFEIESKDGKIVLRGNNGVSIASGLRWYLKNYAHCQVSWCGENLDLPKQLPAVPSKVREITPYTYRVNFNYCTFSYTMPWWSWDRWEKEIDFMAMNGVNMPLAITGQEAVWQNTLRKFKMTDEEIRQFLCGPAFFGWQYMANLEGWGGPLPQQWIDRSIELGRKILVRERELGMTPILQGFTGFVPRELKKKYPDAKIQFKYGWCAVFEGAAQLDPLDPLFAPMGKAFIEEQVKLFGTDHWYASDPFHESAPPSKAPDYLANVAKAILDTTLSADPDAKLAMQSWSLRKPIAENTPQDRMLILHLVGGGTKDSFVGREWVSGQLHNYGGRLFLGGNIKNVLQRPKLLEKQPETNLVGIGVFPEGIEHNPAFFEAAYEIAWLHKPVSLQPWLVDYIHARYGVTNSSAEAAWKILGETVYGNNSEAGSAESPICSRPALEINRAGPNAGMKRNYNAAALWPAYAKMLEAAPALGKKDTFRYDLVDVARQCLADLSIPLQRDITIAYDSGDTVALKQAADRFLDLANDMDRLLSTRQEFLLGKWIADARACGNTPEEKNQYEYNARLLPTVWGPSKNNALLFDYSNRQWAGLIKGYYIPRWKKFIAYLESQPAAGENRFTEASIAKRKSHARPANNANDFYKELSEWEYKWCKGKEHYSAIPEGDSVVIARELYKKWQPLVKSAYQRLNPSTLKPGVGGDAAIYSE